MKLFDLHCDSLYRGYTENQPLVSGGEIDTERASIMVLDEFRSAKLGKITLEQVNG